MDNIGKVQQDLSNIVEKEIFFILTEKAIPEFLANINDVYESTLNDIVSDSNSKTRPELFKTTFMERLNNFNFLETQGGKITFKTPDMETFDFSGKLRILQTIMEGIVGQYVEISGEDYLKVFGKKKIDIDPLDSEESDKNRIYLIKYSTALRKKEDELHKKFVKYPFSNMPPIDLFDTSNKFIETNLNTWIEEATQKAIAEFTKRQQGAKI